MEYPSVFLNSTALAKRYLSLMPVTPPAIYGNAAPLERATMEHQDESSCAGFNTMFALDLRGKDVLDLGCGYGGRTVYFKEIGARSISGIEIAEKMVNEAIAFAKHRGVELNAKVGFGESIPFPADSFDVITSYDVFEHVASLPETLAECYRVLRPGGTLYAVFPPFYHPTGGAHIHGYLSRSPAPNLIFSNNALRRAIYELLSESGISYRPMDRPTDALPSVNGATVSGFLRMLHSVPFARKVVRLKPLHRLPAIGTAIPFVREVWTNKIVAALTK